VPQLRRGVSVNTLVTMRTFRRWGAVAPMVAVVVAVVGTVAHAAPRLGAPPVVPMTPPCSAGALRATYTIVTGSGATGHVEYTLTITNRSAATCRLATPPALALLGAHGQALATHATFTPSTPGAVTLGPGQWAQAVSQLSPDLAGPGEPTSGNCEPVAHALRITVGAGAVRAAMDPTPVCEQGAIQFGTLAAIGSTPACASGQLAAGFTRDSLPFDGFAEYSLTLRNRGGRPCHLRSIAGLRLRGAHGRHLATTVRAGISSPVVLQAHRVLTATARVATAGGHCDQDAPRVAVTPVHGGGSTVTTVRPPVRACRRGLIQLSSLFVNG
jgi:hypothetical protein